MKKKNKFITYEKILMLPVLIIYILFLTGCGDDTPCDGPHYADGNPTEFGACINECDAPGECDRTQPGGKGPDCELGQVCNTDCECEWVDRDLDGYTTIPCREESKNTWMNIGETTVSSSEWTVETFLRSTGFRIVQVSQGATNIHSVDVYDEDGFFKTYDNYDTEVTTCREETDPVTGETETVCETNIVPYYIVENTKWTTGGNTEGDPVEYHQYVKTLTEDWGNVKSITKIVVSMSPGVSATGKSTPSGGKINLDLYARQYVNCDCDDYNPYIFPQAEELCDNADNDCDGLIDEGDACPKNLYICKNEAFSTQHRGDGEELSYGKCNNDEYWCEATASGIKGYCSYSTTEDDVGPHEFFSYFCDEEDCYKSAFGGFQVCGGEWDCEAVCLPGDCNYELKLVCNNAGIWQPTGWCHSDCGRADSECGGNCDPGACDPDVKMVCDEDGYWTDENYCDCDVCGNIDSACSSCTCQDGFCDTLWESYCEGGVWTSDTFYLQGGGTCCKRDSDGYEGAFCGTCIGGVCNTEKNTYCSDNQWLTSDYCDNCGGVDYDCGATRCIHGLCDIVNDKYCDSGYWKTKEEIGVESYCFPGYCGIQDPDCGCSNEADDPKCCLGEFDGTCDPDCTQDSDADCFFRCTSDSGDCCDSTSDGECDADCIDGLDPDCRTDCEIEADDCCSGFDDGTCDPDCAEEGDVDCFGQCTNKGGDCCNPDNDGYCDPDCIQNVDSDCATHPCEENWFCAEEDWDHECDGVYDTHTCANWVDLNGCNTFFDRPSDTVTCYTEYTCNEDDDTDLDGYPERACYDSVNDVVIDEADCDDNDAAQNPLASEICNGEDDNCDDSVDEDCPCIGGQTQQCGRSEGICRPGIQTCVGGYWTICGGPGYIKAQKEACDDGIDNNCDGYIDEGCECSEGDTQECGSEEGICTKGYQACYLDESLSTFSFGGECNNATQSVTEVCDNSIDDDCDAFTDGEDSNCQVETPVTESPSSCSNRKQDGKEEGVDCGGDCPSSCDEKDPACDYGEIEEKCVCGRASYRTGYCCNGKYSVSACKEEVQDSDNDGCSDDQEFQLGTNPYAGDTDFDGLLDCDSAESFPLCNEDGVCDSERDYPETLDNCLDCAGKAIGWLTWLILILIILGLACVGGYLYAQHKGYKLSDFVKLKKGKKTPEKKEFKQAYPKETFLEKLIKPAEEKLSEKPVQKPVEVKAKPTPEKTAKKNMIKLRAFVNNSLRKGYTKLQVRKEAMKTGYTKEQIDKALKGKKSSYKLFK